MDQRAASSPTQVYKEKSKYKTIDGKEDLTLEEIVENIKNQQIEAKKISEEKGLTIKEIVKMKSPSKKDQKEEKQSLTISKVTLLWELSYR